MQLNLQELRSIVQKSGGEILPPTAIVTRRISRVITWCLIHMGVRANTVTIASLVIGVAGGFGFMYFDPRWYAFGWFCLMTWYILDHVDGELARYWAFRSGARTKYSGAYLDTIVHRWVQPLAHVAIGFALSREYDHAGYFVLGLFAGSAYVGWVRTTATSVLLAKIADGKVAPGDARIRKLVALGHVSPRYDVATSTREWIVKAGKSVKLVIAYPAFIYFLGAASLAEFTIGDRFGASPLAVYLSVTAALAVAQGVYGMWHVAALLDEDDAAGGNPAGPAAGST